MGAKGGRNNGSSTQLQPPTADPSRSSGALPSSHHLSHAGAAVSGSDPSGPQPSQQDKTVTRMRDARTDSPTPPPQFSRPSPSDLPDRERAAIPASQGRPSRDLLDYNGPQSQSQSQSPSQPAADKAPDARDVDPYHGTPWQASSVVRSNAGRPSNDWGRPSEDTTVSYGPSQRGIPPTITEDSGVGFVEQADLPKRAPSFVGLPPIRRNSGFDFLSDTPGFSFLSDPDESDEHTVDDVSKAQSQSNDADAARQLAQKPLPREPVEPVEEVPEPQREPTPPPPIQPRHVESNAGPSAPAIPPQPISNHPPAPARAPLPPVQTQMSPNQFPIMFPAGQWKLEESHLAEPLAPMSRNRSGTGSSAQPVVYGYDKETGLPLTGSPESHYSPRVSPTRVRNNHASPAQRYPERLGERSNQAQPGPVEPKPSAGDVRGDGVSETSVATADTNRKKKRSSFLPSLLQRDSSDIPSGPSQESFHHGRKGSFAGSEAESYTDRKRTLLGGAISSMSATSRFRMKQSGQPRSETPTSLREYRPDDYPSENSPDNKPAPAAAAQEPRQSKMSPGAGMMSPVPGARFRDSNQPAFARTPAGDIEPQSIMRASHEQGRGSDRRSSQLSPGLRDGNSPGSPGAPPGGARVRSPTPSGPAPPVPPPPPPEQRLLPEGAQSAPVHTQLYGPPRTSINASALGISADRILKAQRSPEASTFDHGRSSTPEPSQSNQTGGRGGALLKGLRNRMSEQVSQVTAKGDEKGAASRLRNAFKRGSKQSEKTQQGQWRPSQPGSQPPAQGMGMRGPLVQGRAPPGAPQDTQPVQTAVAPPFNPVRNGLASPGRGAPQGPYRPQQIAADQQNLRTGYWMSEGAVQALRQKQKAPPSISSASGSMTTRPDNGGGSTGHSSGASHPNSVRNTNGSASGLNTPRQVASPSPGATVAANRESDGSQGTVGDGGARVQEPVEGPRVELEDTEEARKRAIRLASQEEKILYDPEDDPNHMPVMSATSYPGQEWNPYGVEYGDWKDD
ncbi:hypothetical protein B0I35DRAFT_94076 [Stachybotrys elegans]|uniref:Uncharacterized protein n=1 Tax=Stachybotrys elegans TaxID=80388 RepID=A0A8K0SLS7_9HYPO|nr:hypothetical protein B0I35DRAFT_94076 [Stachybotrys elegans]